MYVGTFEPNKTHTQFTTHTPPSYSVVRRTALLKSSEKMLLESFTTLLDVSAMRSILHSFRCTQSFPCVCPEYQKTPIPSKIQHLGNQRTLLVFAGSTGYTPASRRSCLKSFQAAHTDVRSNLQQGHANVIQTSAHLLFQQGATLFQSVVCPRHRLAAGSERRRRSPCLASSSVRLS
jgi:hypothetical protein